MLTPKVHKAGIFLGSCLAVLSIASNAGAADLYTNRTGLKGLSRIVSPRIEQGAAAAAAIDYTNGDLLYAASSGSQTRRYLSLGVSALDWLEVGVQYRGVDTRTDLVEPSRLTASGDILVSSKLAWQKRRWAVGLLSSLRHYYGHGKKAYAVHGLVERSSLDWSLLAEAGWNVERPVPIEAPPSPLRSFAWQKPGLNYAFLGLGATYALGWGDPRFEYYMQRFVGEGVGEASTQHAVVLSVALRTIFDGLTAVPEVVMANATPPVWFAPYKPSWRGGLAISYELPVRALYEALFPPPGKLVTIVTDEVGQPVTNVTVAVGGRVFSTGARDTLERELPPGAYRVRVTAPGYLETAFSAVVESRETVEQKVAITKNAGILRGRVLLGGEPGGEGIAVSIFGIPLPVAEGTFAVEIPPGDYSLQVSAPGYRPQTRDFRLARSQVVTFDPIDLEPLIRVLAPWRPAATAASVKPVSAPTGEPSKTSLIDEALNSAAEKLAEKPVTPTETFEKEIATWLEDDVADGSDAFDSPLFFEFGEWRLHPHAFRALDRVAEVLKNDPGIKRLVIEGRADAIGPQEVNLIIAAKRAEVVYNYLRSKGIADQRLATTKTVYQRKPVRQSDEVRAEDRRVGFRIER